MSHAVLAGCPDATFRCMRRCQIAFRLLNIMNISLKINLAISWWSLFWSYCCLKPSAFVFLLLSQLSLIGSSGHHLVGKTRSLRFKTHTREKQARDLPAQKTCRCLPLLTTPYKNGCILLLHEEQHFYLKKLFLHQCLGNFYPKSPLLWSWWKCLFPLVFLLWLEPSHSHIPLSSQICSHHADSALSILSCFVTQGYCRTPAIRDSDFQPPQRPEEICPREHWSIAIDEEHSPGLKHLLLNTDLSTFQRVQTLKTFCCKSENRVKERKKKCKKKKKSKTMESVTV